MYFKLLLYIYGFENRIMKKTTTFLLLILSFFVFGQENLLDTSFGTSNGQTNFSFYNSNGQPTGGVLFHDSVKLPDGKILSVGVGVIARFTSNGILDSTFNDTGYKLISPFGNYLRVLPSPDQHFVLLDIAFGGKILKIDSDGNPVSSFTNYNQSASYVDIDLDNQGNIYLLKHNNYNYYVTKLFSNGSVDTSYANNGSLSLGNTYRYNKLKSNAQGDLFIAGKHQISDSNRRILVTKVNTSGIIDSSFATNGNFLQVSGTYSGDYSQLEILNDGKILGATSGSFCNGSNCFGLIVYRLLPNGTLDTSFRETGIGVIPIQSNSDPSEIKVLPDSSYIISGTGIRSFYAIKLNSNGDFDTTFGTDGKIITPQISPEGYPAYNIGFEIYENAIVLVGIHSIWYGSSTQYIGVLRKYFFSETLSTPVHLNENDILLYPNPVKSVLNIQSSKKITNYKIYDIKGSKVQDSKLQNSEAVNVENLKSGIYLIYLESDELTAIHKFIKK